jgi:hypothetical protein
MHKDVNQELVYVFIISFLFLDLQFKSVIYIYNLSEILSHLPLVKQNMKLKIAKIISTIGHPLLTIPIFVIIILFSYQDLQSAFLVSSLMIGCVFIPLTIKMYRGSKKGTYTNFDVSDRNERQNWYVAVLVSLLILISIFFLTNQSQAVRYNALFFLLLLSIAKIGNYFIKTSLHVSLHVFLSFLFMQINIEYGVLFLVFIFPIAWSRLVLKRHTLREVIYGGINGFAIGILSFVTITVTHKS